MKIKIVDATDGQVLEFAAKNLGLDVSEDSRRSEVLGLMANVGYSSDEIEVDDPAPQVRRGPGRPRKVEAAAAASAGDEDEEEDEIAAMMRKRVKIMIPTQDGPGGEHDVPVGVNGRVILIKRGTPVEIQLPYYLALMDAVKVKWNTDRNGTLTTPVMVPTHPVQLLEGRGYV